MLKKKEKKIDSFEKKLFSKGLTWMSPSEHLPKKMDSQASSPDILRRLSADAKASVRLPGRLRSGA